MTPPTKRAPLRQQLWQHLAAPRIAELATVAAAAVEKAMAKIVGMVVAVVAAT